MTDHDPQSPAARRRRSRALLAAGALVFFGSTAWLALYTRETAARNEARVIAGDFPALRVERARYSVDEYGRVAVDGLLTKPPLTVGSTRLIPRGDYTCVIVANDGNPEHRKKTEVVIAAQDGKGVWHPPTAARVFERIGRQRPGSPL